MSEITIRVEELSKLYRMGQFEGYQTLRESILNPKYRHRAQLELLQWWGL